jgi:hypothetical protein
LVLSRQYYTKRLTSAVLFHGLRIELSKGQRRSDRCSQNDRLRGYFSRLFYENCLTSEQQNPRNVPTDDSEGMCVIGGLDGPYEDSTAVEIQVQMGTEVWNSWHLPDPRRLIMGLDSTTDDRF